MGMGSDGMKKKIYNDGDLVVVMTRSRSMLQGVALVCQKHRLSNERWGMSLLFSNGFLWEHRTAHINEARLLWEPFDEEKED